LISSQTSAITSTERTTGHSVNCSANTADECLCLAEKINLTLNGSGFSIIVNPEQFKEYYNRKFTDVSDPSEPDFCTMVCSANYNISEIDRPKLDGQTLVFYVTNNGKIPIPYRVTSLNPHSMNVASRQILPRVK
jgi:hypothetical protein